MFNLKFLYLGPTAISCSEATPELLKTGLKLPPSLEWLHPKNDSNGQIKNFTTVYEVSSYIIRIKI